MDLETVVDDLIRVASWPGAIRYLRPALLDPLLVRQDRATPDETRRALDDSQSVTALAPWLDLDTAVAELERRTASTLRYPFMPVEALVLRIVTLGERARALTAIAGQPAEVRFELLGATVDTLPADQAAPLLAEMVAHLAGEAERALAEACRLEPYPRAISLHHMTVRQTGDTPSSARLALVAANLDLAELPPSSQPDPSWRLQAFRYPIPASLRARALAIADALAPADRVRVLLDYAANTDPAVLPRAIAEAMTLSLPHRMRASIMIAAHTGHCDATTLTLIENWAPAMGHPDWPASEALWPGRTPYSQVDAWTELAWQLPGSEHRGLTDRAVAALDRELLARRQRELLRLLPTCVARAPEVLLRGVLAAQGELALDWIERVQILCDLRYVKPEDPDVREQLAAQLQRITAGGRETNREESALVELLEDDPELQQPFALALLASADRITDPRPRRAVRWAVASLASGEAQRLGFAQLWDDPGAWEPPTPWFARVLHERGDLADAAGLLRVWAHCLRMEPHFDPMTTLSLLCPLFPDARDRRARRAEVIAGYAETMHEDSQDIAPPFAALSPQLEVDEVHAALAVVDGQPHAADWQKDAARHALLLRLVDLAGDPGTLATQAATITDLVMRTEIEMGLPRPPDLDALLARIPDVITGPGLDRFVALVLKVAPNTPRLALALVSANGAVPEDDRRHDVWRGIANAAIAGGEIERVIAHHASTASVDADAQAALLIALIEAFPLDDPRIAPCFHQLATLADQVADSLILGWGPVVPLLVSGGDAARWLARLAADGEDSVHRARGTRELLEAWVPTLHRIGGDALLARIVTSILQPT